MKKSIVVISSMLLLAVGMFYALGSCKKEDNPNGLTYLPQEIPEGFPDPVYRFLDNPVTKEGFELGRKLFYDGRLSLDGNYPCASCHQQIAGFGTFEHDRSHGYNHSHTLRNAPPLFNLAWEKNFHWDGAFDNFEKEPGQPINTMTEMAETFNGVIDKLEADPEYREMFRKAFRTEFISADYMLKALAQFTGSFVSADSRFDRYKKGQGTLNTQETEGYQLFKVSCEGCHPEPMFTDYSFRNIGLPIDPELNDFGRMMVTHRSQDSLKFRVPSLRNVYISSNYMHDGRFGTLAQCINHYRTGIQQSATLDPAMRAGFSFTDDQAVNIGLFLRTLTDSVFITNPKYAHP